MRLIFGLVLIAGLGLAGFAVYMVQGYVSQTEAQLDAERAIREQAGPLVEVFVVNKPLNYGDALTRDDVQKIYWPENFLPETIFRDEALLFPEGETSPRYVKRSMETFDPLLAIRVTEPGEAAGLADDLALGTSAFTIRFDGASGMSRYLEAGDRVDIYWTGSRANAEGEVTQLIESSVRLIAVDRPAGVEGQQSIEAPRTITVEVSREQVARLTQGQATGQLTVSLVARDDDSVTSSIEVDGNSLLGTVEAPVVEAAPVDKVCTIRERKGGAMVETPITCTN